MRARVSKVLAQAGVCSRRGAEEYIREGRVTVNGQVVKESAVLVDPANDHIKVDGRRLRPVPPSVYILLNKPKGVVTSLEDPQGRPTVADVLRGVKARVFPVGRLDYDTEGLLLLTNDGELANRLLHPRYGLERVYLAKVKGIPSREILERFRRGIPMEAGSRGQGDARLHRSLKANAWIEVVVREGKHHEVRRMCESVGHPVIALRRIGFGPLTLEGVPLGRYRHLTPTEVQALQRWAKSASEQKRPERTS
jgi:23S rRNA pseudouridine2605 synthase